MEEEPVMTKMNNVQLSALLSGEPCTQALLCFLRRLQAGSSATEHAHPYAEPHR